MTSKKAAKASKRARRAVEAGHDRSKRSERSRLEVAEQLYQIALMLIELAGGREAALERRERMTAKHERALAKRDKRITKRERALADRVIPATRAASANAGSPAKAAAPTAVSVEAYDPGDDADLERARLEALLQRAHLDPLTGAFRREAGRLALRNEIDRARRGDGRFVLAFVDVDGLKAVNDQQGHAAGDRLLRTLVAIMRANLRSYDPIVRMGGDEFVCGIASIDVEEAHHRLAVIDQSMRAATGTGIAVGIATLLSDESLDQVIARADEALLQAKHQPA